MLLAWSSNPVPVQMCYFYPVLSYTWTRLGPKPPGPILPSLQVFFFTLILHWCARFIMFFAWRGVRLLALWVRQLGLNGYHENPWLILYTAQNVSKSGQNHDWCPVDLWGNKSHEWFCSWDLHHHKSVWNGLIPAHETGVSYGSRPGRVPFRKRFDVIWWS